MYSMTGFGRGEHATSALIARVELTSINRKQAEVLVQMPRIYSELEAEIRKLALEKISRGRLTINIQLETATEATNELKIDTAKVLALQAEIQRLNDLPNAGLDLKLTPTDILRLPDVLTTADNTADIDTARAAILPALTAGLESLMTMRASEGSHLKKDTLDRLSTLEAEAGFIESQAPAVLTRYRENLHKRLTDHMSGLETDLTDERILKEIGLFAEKCDISEEITRLNSHFQKFREYLATAGDQPVGRSLDFLCQELNREFNTIGSKANDAQLAQHVVNAKTELEKIREQIQNVE
tara:strand:- start:33 stop:926 length:894 start_codon:yes stop_codon:yes gene_type:complete